MPSFWLEYIEDGQRREFSFDSASVSVGRDKTSDFVVDHPTVSRQHALIVAGQQGHQLVVLSRGGMTAIDGNQVQGENTLFDGSEVHFGQLSFTYRSNSAPRKPAAEQQNGWTQSGNFGAQPVASPGHQSQQFGQPNPSGHQSQQFGQPNPSGHQSQQFQQQPHPSGFGQAAGSGGYGQMDGFGQNQPAQAQAPAPAPAADGWNTDSADADLVSWEQIAQSAEAEEAGAGGGRDRSATDFQRIQAAQAKAVAQSEGNPAIKIVGIVGIVVLLAVAFWPRDKKVQQDESNEIVEEKAFIEWQKGDIDCIGQAACEADALAAYRVGKKTWEQKGADIQNLFESYRQFDRATMLLEQGGIAALPPEMGDVAERKSEALSEMEAIFQQYRVKYHNAEKRKMYKDMAGVLRETRAYFPDKRAKYHQWALAKERKMKEDGVYPKATYMGVP